MMTFTSLIYDDAGTKPKAELGTLAFVEIGCTKITAHQFKAGPGMNNERRIAIEMYNDDEGKRFLAYNLNLDEAQALSKFFKGLENDIRALIREDKK
jgi:hypothetical protein